MLDVCAVVGHGAVLVALLITAVFKFRKVHMTAEVCKIYLSYFVHTNLSEEVSMAYTPSLSLTFFRHQIQVILCHLQLCLYPQHTKYVEEYIVFVLPSVRPYKC